MVKREIRAHAIDESIKIISDPIAPKYSLPQDTVQSNQFLDDSSLDSTDGVIQILIVDDQQFVRNMLEYALSNQAGLEVISTAASGSEAIAQMAQGAADVALVDVEMPEMNGLTLTQCLAKQYPQTKVIILSIHDETFYVQQALDAGAQGYLLKNTPPDEIAHAIRFVDRGYLQLGPGLFEKLDGSLSSLSSSLAVSGSVAGDSIPNGFIFDSGRTESHQDTHPIRRLIELASPPGAGIPKKWLRRLAYGLGACLLGLISWSCLTKVNQVIVTQGRLEPKSRAILLEAPFGARVASLYVEEGSQVQKGDPIVEFESDRVNVELQQAQSTFTQLQQQLREQQRLKQQLESSIRAQMLQAQSQQRRARLVQAEQGAGLEQASTRLAEQSRQIDRAVEERNAAKRKQVRLNHQSQLELAELKRYQSLLQKGAIPNAQVTAAQRRVNEIQAQKIEAEAKVTQAERLLQDVKRSYDKLKAQLAADDQRADQLQPQGSNALQAPDRVALIQGSLQESEAQIAGLTEQIGKARKTVQSLQLRQQQSVVYAPEDGTVFQLPVKESGGAVRRAQPIAKLAPRSSRLVLRSRINNQDINLIKEGMPVKLKFEDFPAQKDGLMSGRVASLSSASLTVGTLTPSSEDHTIEISVSQASISSQDQTVALKPGQTASAEIEIRQRRVIEIILDYLLR